MKQIDHEFTAEDIRILGSGEKVGILASVDYEGLPHLTLITSVLVNDPKHLKLGEFVVGLSKKVIQTNHKVGFAMMTLGKDLWVGKADWTHLAKSGPDYEIFNTTPMFRYNTYFGINTVHYFDLVETTRRAPLPMNPIIIAALKTMLGKGSTKTGQKETILTPFLQGLFNQLAALKFLAYVGSDGYPVVIPVVQCQAADSRRLAFSTGAFRDELHAIPAGATVAVFCMNFSFEDVLVRGTFNGFRKTLGGEMGTVDLNWVYNSMPPAIGQLYPPVEFKALTEF